MTDEIEARAWPKLQKAPDPAIWNQTRGTPYAGKAFSRARGRPANAKYRFLGFKGSSWAVKKRGMRRRTARSGYRAGMTMAPIVTNALPCAA